MRILLSIVANAVALLATAYVVPGISFAGTWVQLLVAGAIFGLLNLIVRPIASCRASSAWPWSRCAC